MKNYRIKSILHTGVEGKRYTSRTDGRYPFRINRIVQFDEKDIIIGEKFCLNYIYDEDGNEYRWKKRTSYVVDWDYVFDNVIRIETYCSIYEFEEIKGDI